MKLIKILFLFYLIFLFFLFNSYETFFLTKMFEWITLSWRNHNFNLKLIKIKNSNENIKRINK